MSKLATRKILSLLGMLLFSACSICDRAPWASVVHLDNPICKEAMDPTKPRLDWVMSRVPMGVVEFEATGYGLDGPNVKVLLSDQRAPAPGAKIPVSVERLPDMGPTPRWRIKPQWGSANLVPGQGRLLISSNDQEVSAMPTTLVIVNFKETSTLSVSATCAVDPTWIYMGNAVNPMLFLFGNATLCSFPYAYADGSFSVANIINNQGLSASPINMGKQTPTEFSFIKQTLNYKVVDFYYAATANYQETDAIVGDVNNSRYVNAAAGPTNETTSPTLLWAFLDETHNLRTCPWARGMGPNPKPPEAEIKCKNTPFPPPVSGMWVKPLRASAPADVVLIEPSGLHVLRPDLVPIEYAVPTVAGAGGPRAVAFVESDKPVPIDLVTAHAGGVVRYRNDGKGSLSPLMTQVTTMPAAQALTSMNLDNDGKPDLLIKDTDGKLWLMLNESDGVLGDGLFSAPVAAWDSASQVQIDVGAKGQVTGDGNTAERLITYTAQSKTLRSWDRQAMPSN